MSFRDFPWISITALIACLSAVSPLHAQDDANSDTNTAHTVGQRSITVRGTLYRWLIKDYEPDGYKMQLRFRGSASFYEFKTLDDLLSIDFDSVSTIGLNAKLQASVPIKGLKYMFAEPDVTAGTLWDFATERNEPSASGTARIAFNSPGFYQDLRLGLMATYGTKFAEDTLAIDDYVYLAIDAQTRHYLGLSSGDYRWMISPYAKFSHYFDTLQLASPDGDEFNVTRTYELGFTIETEPRYKVWIIKLPKIKINYRFGDDIKGVAIGL